MRSRYTAFVTRNIDYIFNTIDPAHRAQFDKQETTRWAEDSKWLGLEIVATRGGEPDAIEGTVEFVAHYERNKQKFTHHELGKFTNKCGTWYYTEGKVLGSEQFVHHRPKTGRNEACPCGSGQKFKRCCGRTH